VAATIVWFRNDLRLADNPALDAATQRGGEVIPVYIWAPEEEGRWSPGAASRWWLHQSLLQLDAALREHGSRLILRRGPTGEALRGLAAETHSDAVFWNRRYEPAVVARDTTIKATLRSDGVRVDSFNGSLLFEPWTIHTKADRPFQVFTPFWRSCLDATPPARPLPTPRKLAPPKRWPGTAVLESFALEPSIDWAGGIRSAWRPGETGAGYQLRRFLDSGLAEYSEQRNRPDVVGSSRLSPHLHFGELSPRQVWHAVHDHVDRETESGMLKAGECFLREIGWREFSHHLLFHFAHTIDTPLRPEFERFPWRDDLSDLQAWQHGRTGYPIVDAGMRELWSTGWMHNRVRMIAASFLVKDLLIPWRGGAEWFWDTLVDADLANNTLGWQWTSGCGADAAPYFRVFNPVSQGEKFDPGGGYVRRWVPELAGLASKWLHRPWEAPTEVLAAARIDLGTTYPLPIVDHSLARQRALAAFAAVKRSR